MVNQGHRNTGSLRGTLLIAAPAMAIWDWCDVDPTLSIGGHTASLDAAYLGNSHDINGKITFIVTVPRGTPVSIGKVDPGVQLKIRYDGNSSNGIPVAISAGIKAKTNFDTKLTVVLDEKQLVVENGTTNNSLDYSFVTA